MNNLTNYENAYGGQFGGNLPPAPTEQMRYEHRQRVQTTEVNAGNLGSLMSTPGVQNAAQMRSALAEQIVPSAAISTPISALGQMIAPVNAMSAAATPALAMNTTASVNSAGKTYRVDFSVPQHLGGSAAGGTFLRLFLWLVVLLLVAGSAAVFYCARTGQGPDFVKQIVRSAGIANNSNAEDKAPANGGNSSGVDKTVGVDVVNGSDISGLADSNAKKLKEAGFSNAVADNFNGEKPQQNVVYYKSSASTAKKIAEILGIKVVVQNSQIDAPIQVVLVAKTGA